MIKKYNFENSLVVFLDILGFKELIKKNDMESKILDLLYEFRDFNLSAKEQYTEDEQNHGHSINIEPNIISFSDHIILSIPLYKDVPSAPSNAARIHLYLYVIRNYVSKICFAALLKGIILRGSISTGEMYCDLENNIVTGDALIEAISNEAQAIYPRIIISDSLIKYSKKFHASGVLHEHISKRDFDGLYYIDYLYFGLKNLPPEERITKVKLVQSHIVNNIKNIENDEIIKNKIFIKSKWFWLANYFEQTLSSLIKENLITDDDYKIIKPVMQSLNITIQPHWDSI